MLNLNDPRVEFPQRDWAIAVWSPGACSPLSPAEACVRRIQEFPPEVRPDESGGKSPHSKAPAAQSIASRRISESRFSSGVSPSICSDPRQIFHQTSDTIRGSMGPALWTG
jgi:hypothetical protein